MFATIRRILALPEQPKHKAGVAAMFVIVADQLCYGPFYTRADAEAYARENELVGYQITVPILPAESWSYEDILAREG